MFTLTPKVGDIYRLIDGTEIKVITVYEDRLVAKRIDGNLFTPKQVGYNYREACWEFDGKRGFGKTQGIKVEGMPIDMKHAMEQEVAAFGGTITWTDPDVLTAREIWANHARPAFGADRKAILRGDYDHGQAMQAIIEAVKFERAEK